MGIDRKVDTFLLMFDFSKAFDTIPPSKLLQSSPSVDQSISTRPIPTCSVEKQLIKMPIHVFRIPTGVCSGSLDVNRIFHHFYPDDLQIYVQVLIGWVHKGLVLLSQAAQQVKAWAELLSLKLNAGKTQAIFFGSSLQSPLSMRLRVLELY